MTSSFTWFGSHIVFNIKPSEIFSVRAEQIEAKLYRYDRLSMRDKKFSTHDVMSHGLAAIIFLKNKPLKSYSLQLRDRSRGNFTHMFPKPWGYQGVHE